MFKIILFIFLALNLQTQLKTTYKKHKTYLKNADISNNLEFIATMNSKEIQIRKTSNSSLVNKLSGFATEISSMTFHSNNRLLIAGTISGLIYIWNIESGQIISSIKAHDDEITDLILHPKNVWLISASKDKKIRIHNIHTKERIRTLSKHKGQVTDIDLKSNKLLSSSNNGEIIYWDIEDGDDIESFKIKNAVFQQVLFNNSKEAFLSLTKSGTIHRWDVDTEKAKETFKTKKENDIIILCTPKKQKIIIASQSESKIDFINLKNWKVEKSIDTRKKMFNLKYTHDQLNLFSIHKDAVQTHDASYFLSDTKKLNLFIDSKVNAFMIPLEKEKEKDYKKRTSKKIVKEKTTKWLEEALYYFGKKKYQVLNDEPVQMEYDEKSKTVRVFASTLEPIYIKLKKNEFKKFQRYFSKMKLTDKKFVYSDKKIILKTAKFSHKKFSRKIKYNYESVFEFKGIKISKELKVSKLKYKL